jgi:hypothetical protein
MTSPDSGVRSHGQKWVTAVASWWTVRQPRNSRTPPVTRTTPWTARAARSQRGSGRRTGPGGRPRVSCRETTSTHARGTTRYTTSHTHAADRASGLPSNRCRRWWWTIVAVPAIAVNTPTVPTGTRIRAHRFCRSESSDSRQPAANAAPRNAAVISTRMLQAKSSSVRSLNTSRARTASRVSPTKLARSSRVPAWTSPAEVASPARGSAIAAAASSSVRLPRQGRTARHGGIGAAGSGRSAYWSSAGVPG